MTLVPMDALRAYIKKMQQELTELNLDEMVVRMGFELSLKNVFACNFGYWSKWIFYIQKNKMYVLGDYDSNTTDGIEIQGPKVLE